MNARAPFVIVLLLFFLHERQQVAVAFCCHFVFRYKLQRGAIDTVAQTTKLTRPIWENVSEVGVARFAPDFNPLHTIGTIF